MNNGVDNIQSGQFILGLTLPDELFDALNDVLVVVRGLESELYDAGDFRFRYGGLGGVDGEELLIEFLDTFHGFRHRAGMFVVVFTNDGHPKLVTTLAPRVREALLDPLPLTVKAERETFAGSLTGGAHVN
uniref:Uncharacterized protein n=1 Tax=Cacopsylla melanoneura TaxID=428564 RepID=A0A8D8TJ81_9HEMI